MSTGGLLAQNLTKPAPDYPVVQTGPRSRLRVVDLDSIVHELEMLNAEELKLLKLKLKELVAEEWLNARIGEAFDTGRVTPFSQLLEKVEEMGKSHPSNPQGTR